MKIILVLGLFYTLLCLNTGYAGSQEPDVIEQQSSNGAVQNNLQATPENDLLKGKVETFTEFHITNNIQVDLNNVSGPGADSSSLTDGTLYRENINFYGKGKSGKLDYIFNAGGKATNDRRIDVKDLSLTSLKGQATYEDHTVTSGDVFESFSQYSLNTNLKGLSYKFYDTTDSLPDVTAVFGYAYPRWDSLFQADEVKTLRRRAYGMNIRKDIYDNFDIGFSYVRSDDDDRQDPSDTQYGNSVYSLDYEYGPIPGLTISGESALNNGKQQLTQSENYDSYSGHAHRIDAIGVGGPSRVTLGYEYVSPEFQTLVGSAAQGRQKAKARWKYKIAKNTTMNTALLWYQTGLAKGVESVQTYRPEIGFTKKRFLDRRYARAGINYKFSHRYGNQQRSNDHFINLSYRDRIGFVDMDNRFGLNTYQTNNNVRKTVEYNYHTALSSRHRVGALVFKPSVNAGSEFIDDEIRNTLDKIVEYSVGLGIDAPKHKINSNLKFGQNMLDTGGGDDSNKYFANLRVHYKPGFLNGSLFFLRGAINDYNFSTESRNFEERSITLGISTPFDTIIGKK